MGKTFSLCKMWTAGGLCALSSWSCTTDQHPNIILFLVDDMGWQDTSVPFYSSTPTALNERFHTPNMERLEKMGVQFTQAYACCLNEVGSPDSGAFFRYRGSNGARRRSGSYYSSRTFYGYSAA